LNKKILITTVCVAALLSVGLLYAFQPETQNVFGNPVIGKYQNTGNYDEILSLLNNGKASLVGPVFDRYDGTWKQNGTQIDFEWENKYNGEHKTLVFHIIPEGLMCPHTSSRWVKMDAEPLPS